jgi:hypothetical protein
MRRAKYEALKDEYPETISLDQLRRICRVSKRSALYLIQNGIISYTETGKKTWRYKIALDDVITYLCRREQIGSMIPVGSVSSRCRRLDNSRKAFAEYVSRGNEHQIAEYFKYIYSDYPDVLTQADIAEMTGVSKKTIHRYTMIGAIKTLGSGRKTIIPKSSLLDFVVSPRFIDCKSNSEILTRILGGFELWKAAKSLP